MPGERQKDAEEIAESLLWSDSADRRRGTSNHPEVQTVATRFAAWAKEREDSAMLEAAGLMCHRCADLKTYGEVKKVGNSWMHKNGYACGAEPIHRRLAERVSE